MTPDLKNVLVFISLLATGVLLEDVLVKFYTLITNKSVRKVHFSLGRYAFLMLTPMLTIILFSIKQNINLTTIFISFSVAGTALEWLVGYSYHQIVGQRLWTYHRYSLKGYTSLLSIPLWGLGGVLFWLIAKAFV